MSIQKIITNDQRGLLFRQGNYLKCLKPGSYFFLPFSGYEIKLLDVTKPFIVSGKSLNLFLQDKPLLEELTIIEVKDYELALHMEDGLFTELLRAGKYAYWNVLKKHEFITIDPRQPEIQPELTPLLSNSKLSGSFVLLDIASYETGILYYNNVQQRIVNPGRYYFWTGAVTVTVAKIDLRQQQLDITGQEILTEDKVPLRLNFICQYRIVDPLKIVSIKSYEEQIYIVLQLILREYVGSLKFDELLAKKQEIGAFVLSRLTEKSGDFGVVFIYAGLKDIILPGDIKEIINTVLIAEKKAQANVITRREEIASTRSLLNTAKLMDENQTLYRLKELEFLEKICEKIGNISVMGGCGLLEQLNSLFAAGKNQKTN
jgi:regulator of protease activity HflC (stomatin/prohibitin superfamily)